MENAHDNGKGGMGLDQTVNLGVFGDDDPEYLEKAGVEEEEGGGAGANTEASGAEEHQEEEAQERQTVAEEVELEKGHSQTTETQGEEGRLFASKYKTVDDLRAAFVNLGGNPNNYDTPEKLEIAYEVRRDEWNRLQAENGERARLEQIIETQNLPAKEAPEGVDPEALLKKVDWSKVETAEDLGRELLTLISQVMPKAEPNSLPSPQELVGQIEPILRQREEANRQLEDLERDVPSLRITPGATNEFRDAFANFVLGQKRSKSFADLKTSMTQFLNFGKKIADEQVKIKGQGREEKLGAAPMSEGGEGTHTEGKGNEVDDIIGAFKQRQEKMGL